MIKIKCKQCGLIFHRHKSRKAVYCSSDCANNHKRRKILPNFSIDSSENCYWAGFLFGDGSIDDSGKLQLCLGVKDTLHAKKFSQFIFGYDFVNVYSDRCHIQCTSVKLASELSRFGIKPNKTYNSSLILPKRFTKDFIRGFFDADGWYTKASYKNKGNGKYYDKTILGICSYLPENLELINSYLPLQGTLSKKKSQELYELRWQSKSKIKEIRNFLSGTPKLDRKWI